MSRYQHLSRESKAWAHAYVAFGLWGFIYTVFTPPTADVLGRGATLLLGLAAVLGAVVGIVGAIRDYKLERGAVWTMVAVPIGFGLIQVALIIVDLLDPERAPGGTGRWHLLALAAAISLLFHVRIARLHDIHEKATTPPPLTEGES